MAHAEKNVLIVQSLSGVKNATNSEINSILHNLWYGKRDKLERLEIRKGNDKGELKRNKTDQFLHILWQNNWKPDSTYLFFFECNPKRHPDS